jgi:hypothetical protein
LNELCNKLYNSMVGLKIDPSNNIIKVNKMVIGDDINGGTLITDLIDEKN